MLAASFVIALLRPYHRNFNKRLVKSPKVYFSTPALPAISPAFAITGSLTRITRAARCSRTTSSPKW